MVSVATPRKSTPAAATQKQAASDGDAKAARVALDVSASVARTGMTAAQVAPKAVAAITAGAMADSVIAYAPQALKYLKPLAIGATALSAGVGAGIGAYKGYQRSGVEGAAKGAVRGAADALTLGLASDVYDNIRKHGVSDGLRTMIASHLPGGGDAPRPDGAPVNSPASASASFSVAGNNITVALDLWAQGKHPAQQQTADGNTAGQWQSQSRGGSQESGGSQQPRQSKQDMSKFGQQNRAFEKQSRAPAAEKEPPQYGARGNGMRGFQIAKVQAAAQRAKGNNYQGPEE